MLSPSSTIQSSSYLLDLHQSRFAECPLEITESDSLSDTKEKTERAYTYCLSLIVATSTLLDDYLQESVYHDYATISTLYTPSKKILSSAIRAFKDLETSMKERKEKSEDDFSIPYETRREIKNTQKIVSEQVDLLTTYDVLLEAKLGLALMLDIKKSGFRIANDTIPSVPNRKFADIKKSFLSHQQSAEKHIDKLLNPSTFNFDFWDGDFESKFIERKKEDISNLLKAENLKKQQSMQKSFALQSVVQPLMELKTARNDSIRALKDQLPQRSNVSYSKMFGGYEFIKIPNPGNFYEVLPPLTETFFNRTIEILDQYLKQLSNVSSKREAQAIAYEIDDAFQIANSIYAAICTVCKLVTDYAIGYANTKDRLGTWHAKACAQLTLARLRCIQSYQVHAKTQSLVDSRLRFLQTAGSKREPFEEFDSPESFTQDSPLYLQKKTANARNLQVPQAAESKTVFQRETFGFERAKNPLFPEDEKVIEESLSPSAQGVDQRVEEVRAAALDILERLEDPEILKYSDLIWENLSEAEVLEKHAIDLQKIVIQETSATPFLPKAQKFLQDLELLAQELKSCLHSSCKKKSPTRPELAEFYGQRKHLFHACNNFLKEAGLVLDTCLEKIDGQTDRALLTRVDTESKEVHKKVKAIIPDVENVLNHIGKFLGQWEKSELRELNNEKTQIAIYEALIKMKRAEIFLKQSLLTKPLGADAAVRANGLLARLGDLKDQAIALQNKVEYEDALEDAQKILKSVGSVKDQVHEIFRLSWF